MTDTIQSVLEHWSNKKMNRELSSEVTFVKRQRDFAIERAEKAEREG